MYSEQKNIKIWVAEMENYKLLDSGDKEKLEEINGSSFAKATADKVKIVRAEPRAWWRRELESNKWQGASKELETILDIGIGGIKAKIRFKPGSKHIGIFPEQIEQWRWIADKLKSSLEDDHQGKLNILNLFGYTGIASLVAAQAGLGLRQGPGLTTKVTHVDASKQSVDWARENQKLSGLEKAPIRWIVDDVVKFLKKEIKRGEKYDAIIMDPPSYGKGPKGEVWKIEEKLPDLLSACREVLSDNPIFVIFNMYSTELSSVSMSNLLADMMNGLDGKIEYGELAIKPAYAKASAGKQENPDHSVETDRLLPMSIFAIWQKNK